MELKEEYEKINNDELLERYSNIGYYSNKEIDIMKNELVKREIEKEINSKISKEYINGEEIIIKSRIDLFSAFICFTLCLIAAQYMFFEYYIVIITVALIVATIEGYFSKLFVTKQNIYIKSIFFKNKKIVLKKIWKIESEKIMRTNGSYLVIFTEDKKRISFPKLMGALNYYNAKEIAKVINKYK